MFCRRNSGQTQSPRKVLLFSVLILKFVFFVPLCLRGKSPLFRIEQGRNVNRNHELKPPQRIDLTPCLTE